MGVWKHVEHIWIEHASIPSCNISIVLLIVRSSRDLGIPHMTWCALCNRCTGLKHVGIVSMRSNGICRSFLRFWWLPSGYQFASYGAERFSPPEKPGPQKFPSGLFPYSHQGFRVPDPFAPRGRPMASILHTVLATALFRCWNTLVFFSAWSILIIVLNHQGHALSFQPTLLTVIGTVLGFVISYRTTSSFERYNESRRLWSQIILASRTFARTVWFHVPDHPSAGAVCSDETKTKLMIEKKTAINLLEVYAVAIKHYLRNENSIYYKDLYYLVKFLPGYALPAGIPSTEDLPLLGVEYAHHSHFSLEVKEPLYQPAGRGSGLQLPLSATAPSPRREMFREPAQRHNTTSRGQGGAIFTPADEHKLLPAHMPPRHHLYDMLPFPFSLLAKVFTRSGEQVDEEIATLLENPTTRNIPLEISLYLSSYISSLQTRKIGDVPTIYSALKWLTIPSTIIASFIFFGFLAAGDEIENPFGYDRNDLNLEHFTHNIIRNELCAITSIPPPDPTQWAFAPENNLVFELTPPLDGGNTERVTPEEWIKRGSMEVKSSLRELVRREKQVI
ncbi:Bestrophin, RFP-TM, chloride channel-domain-containing protein [Infundibulicybe gibba]|nr:Bestrophin, RFP-TM, chloride channel-domain-containing protein [Infundibulicybe gibba]